MRKRSLWQKDFRHKKTIDFTFGKSRTTWGEIFLLPLTHVDTQQIHRSPVKENNVLPQ